MTYNMDFLVAALLILLLILYHSMGRRKLVNYRSHMFQWFLALGTVDILFDLITTVLICWENPSLRAVTFFCLTVFYVLQVLVPCGLFVYVRTMYVGIPFRLEKKKTVVLEVLPAMAMLFAVICNCGSGILFRVTAGGEYVKGPWYLSMYFYAGFYGLLTCLVTVSHYKELGKRKFLVVMELLLILAASVGMQAVRNDLLMTGFGLGIGIVVLFLTLDNPYGLTDNLTGVADVQSFQEWVREQFRWGSSFHIITADLYRLKKVNTIQGTSCGDELLKKTAVALQEILQSPYVFRVSGKRFLLAVDSDREYKRALSEVQALFEGGSLTGEDPTDFPAVICGIRDAQRLQNGDNLLAYVEYLVSRTPKVSDTLVTEGSEKTMQGYRYQKEIELFLPTAIEEDLFEVYYQPVFSIGEQDFITLEALSRLKHPTYGYVPPDVFIGIAERNGQIIQIGQLQFRKVCRFLKAHPELMTKIDNVKFNLSPPELLKKGYVTELIRIIHEYELPCALFQFEITETVATEYSEELYHAVEEFSREGIWLCLDDFGAGYANLNTVLRLPFSCVKLDRSLLAGIGEDSKVARFYRNMASVLKNLGYQLIAEGVERQEEVDLLTMWQIDMIQGFYFSRPVSEKEILSLVMQGGTVGGQSC